MQSILFKIELSHVQGENDHIFMILSDEEHELRAEFGQDFMFTDTTVMRSMGLQYLGDQVRADIYGSPITNVWHMNGMFLSGLSTLQSTQ